MIDAFRLPLGRIVATPGALAALELVGAMPSVLLRRHEACDWGDVSAEDQRLNDKDAHSGGRVRSKYTLGGQDFWVITEADRSVTTILLPEEY